MEERLESLRKECETPEKYREYVIGKTRQKYVNVCDMNRKVDDSEIINYNENLDRIDKDFAECSEIRKRTNYDKKLYETINLLFHVVNIKNENTAGPL